MAKWLLRVFGGESVRKLFGIVFSAVLLLCSVSGAWAQKGKVWDLRHYPGGTWAEPRDINNPGVVVGTGDIPSGFVRPIGVPLFGPQALQWFDLGTLGGEVTSDEAACVSIADNGMIVGRSAIKGNEIIHAFAWTQKSGMVDIGTLADLGYTGYNYSMAWGTNRAGTLIAGWSGTGYYSEDTLPVVWTPEVVWGPSGPETTWSIQKLPTIEGSYNWWGEYPNNSGQILGTGMNAKGVEIAVVWNPLPGGNGWKITQLPATSDYPWAYGEAINDNGEIVGSVGTSGFGTEPPVLWQPVQGVKGAYRLVMLPTLPILSGLSLAWSEGMGINDVGDIVGYISSTTGICWATRWSTTNPNFVQLLAYPGTWNVENGEWSIAWKVNDLGIAAGSYGSNTVADDTFAVKFR